MTTPEAATKYRQVYEELHAGILDGRYRPGQKLPSEAQLMRKYDVSRTTVIRAFRDLEAVGMVLRRRGSGTFVAEPSGAVRGPDLALFAPFVERGADLAYVEGLIHQHLAHLAGEHHARLMLQCVSGGGFTWAQRLRDATAIVRGSDVRGVLYYPAELPDEQMHLNRWAVDSLKGAGMAVVLIDRDIVPTPDRSEFTRIGFDNRRGGYLLTDHLIRQGCRRIAFVGIPEASTAVADRLAGYHEALRRHGLAAEEGLVRSADEPELSEQFCRSLMDEARPDAIIGKMDRFAALVGRHLMRMGLRIGRDVKLAGFDDDPIAGLLPVPLTTIRLPAKPFAEAAYQAAMLRIQEPDAAPRQIIIDVELVVRESSTR